jgi:hypothetical protein
MGCDRRFQACSPALPLAKRRKCVAEIDLRQLPIGAAPGRALLLKRRTIGRDRCFQVHCSTFALAQPPPVSRE